MTEKHMTGIVIYSQFREYSSWTSHSYVCEMFYKHGFTFNPNPNNPKQTCPFLHLQIKKLFVIVFFFSVFNHQK